MSSSSKVILITGATRGLGRALARELSVHGHQVFGLGRSWSENELTGKEKVLGFFPLQADVRQEAEVKASVEKVLALAGRLDVVVNNAGITHHAAVEDTPPTIAREVFETNYFAVLSLVRLVLPVMRKQGKGTIAIIGSAAGKIAIPFQAQYVASKFALEGLAEALFHEVKALGIRVVLIEPADVATDIWRQSLAAKEETAAYVPALARFREVKEKEMGEKADSVEKVAREIAHILETESQQLRYPVARGAGFLLLARKLLPDRLFLPLVARHYRLK